MSTLVSITADIYALDGYTVEWASGLPLPIIQQDAGFYKDPSTNLVCTLKKDGFEVDIYCDGEMQVKNLENGDRYYNGSELVAAGYTDDALLTAAEANNKIEWEMNPWFDLYCNGEHLDAVTHEIRDAINTAKSFLEEEIANAHQIEEGMLDLPAL